MKIDKLKKKTFTNLAGSAFLIIVLFLTIFYNVNLVKESKNKIDKANQEANSFIAETALIESKFSEVRKYQKLWTEISNNKKSMNGIKIDDINNNLKKLSENYNIYDPSIQVSLPENLNDNIFNRPSISVLFSKINLNFSAIDDVSAINFINDFVNSFYGYGVVVNFTIKKSKKYSAQDLVNITKGTPSASISGQAEIYLYSYKDKETNKKDNGDSKDNVKN